MGGTYEADAEERSLSKQDSKKTGKESSKSKDEDSQTNRGDNDGTRSSRKRTKSHENSRSERHRDNKREHGLSDHSSHRAHSSGSDNCSRDERIRERRRDSRYGSEREGSRKGVDYDREELHSTVEKKCSREEVKRVADKGDLQKDQKKHSNLETDKAGEILSKGKVNEQKSEEVTSKFAKRSTDDSVMSARERYLARKAARENSKAGRKRTDSDED